MRPYERLKRDEVAARNPVAAAPAAKPLTGRTVLFALLGFFGVVIAVNGVMMALAIGTMPGLENETPYRAGIGYNAEIGAARAQATLRWKVASHVDRDADGRAAVTVEARDSEGAPVPGLGVMVRLVRPTDKRADRTVWLGERETGIYLGTAADVAPGVWEIELEAERGSQRVFRSKNRVTLQ
jgi:nitrogen fixation protein FixH